MTNEAAADKILTDKASDFAESLTALIVGVITEPQPPFVAENLPGRRPRLNVAPRAADQADTPHRLLLPISGSSLRLTLRVSYYMCWDTEGKHLTVEESSIGLGVERLPEPLFRFDYDRAKRSNRTLPSAHLQVHGHRDETLHLLQAADRGRPKKRRARGGIARLSELRFPVGGDRFRPCLEDVLSIAIEDLGVSARPRWRRVLEDSRADYRRKQLAAAVRDSPATAIGVLTEMGWNLSGGPTPRENLERLREL